MHFAKIKKALTKSALLIFKNLQITSSDAKTI